MLFVEKNKNTGNLIIKKFRCFNPTGQTATTSRCQDPRQQQRGSADPPHRRRKSWRAWDGGLQPPGPTLCSLRPHVGGNRLGKKTIIFSILIWNKYEKSNDKKTCTYFFHFYRWKTRRRSTRGAPGRENSFFRVRNSKKRFLNIWQKRARPNFSIFLKKRSKNIFLSSLWLLLLLLLCEKIS